MIRSPFAVFAPFADRFEVIEWTKNDPQPHDARSVLGVKREADAEQTHGIQTAIVREATRRTAGADGLLTDQTGLALSVRFADCQSFIVYAPEAHVVGVLHAGWRGLALHRSEATGAGLIAGAIPEFFATLKKEWDISPQETWVAAGPSLCQRCAAFSDPKHELPAIPPQYIDRKCADLRGAADAQLFALGLPRDHLERSPDCTCCHPETYWTYRGGDREAVQRGERNLLACALKPMLT